jgi:putative ABC transport system substrate-binding protein
LLACATLASGQDRSGVHRIGVLTGTSRPASFETDHWFGPFLQRLKELGYTDKNLVIEWRFSSGDVPKMMGLAEDLVRLKVDLIVTVGSDGIALSQKATPTIPIVFYGGTDLVAQGFVQSLGHPGGHSTGVFWPYGDTLGKQLEFLTEIAPGIKRLALIANSANPNARFVIPIVARATAALNLTNIVLDANTDREMEEAFAEASRQRVQGVIMGWTNFFIDRYAKFAELALKYGLPSVAGGIDYARNGGLIGYGADLTDSWRLMADYVDRILRGAKPGDLPVEQPKKFLLFINRKTARTLGLTVPPELIVQADKVIE